MYMVYHKIISCYVFFFLNASKIVNYESIEIHNKPIIELKLKPHNITTV